MKNLKRILFFFLLNVYPCYAQLSYLEIRPILTNEEAKNIPYNILSYKENSEISAEKLLVGQDSSLVFLDKDIDKIFIICSNEKEPCANPIIKIIYSRDGSKKLSQFSTQNLFKRCAIIFDGKVLMAPIIREPLTSSHVYLSSLEISNKEDAEKFVKELGFEPQYTYFTFGTDEISYMERNLTNRTGKETFEWESVLLQVTYKKQDGKQMQIEARIGSGVILPLNQGPEISIEVSEFFPDFFMDGSTPSSKSIFPNNPAVHFTVKYYSKDKEKDKPDYQGWLYANNPEANNYSNEDISLRLIDFIKK